MKLAASNSQSTQPQSDIQWDTEPGNFFCVTFNNGHTAVTITTAQAFDLITRPAEVRSVTEGAGKILGTHFRGVFCPLSVADP